MAHKNSWLSDIWWWYRNRIWLMRIICLIRGHKWYHIGWVEEKGWATHVCLRCADAQRRENAALKYVISYVADELYNIYDASVDKTKPEYYAVILACHELLEDALYSQFRIKIPKALQRRDEL